MKEFTEENIERIEQLIEDQNSEEARREIRDYHPADIAELFRHLNLKQAEWLFNLIEDNETKADVLMELDEEDRKTLLEGMDPEEIGVFIDLLDTDDAVDLIQELDKEDREEVIQHIDDMEQAGDIVDLLQYDEDTAGGLMGTEFIAVNENMSMPECISEMRRQAEDLDDIYYVYVVDNDERLKGVLPLKKMVTHPSVSRIKHVMEKDPVSVRTDTPIEDVAIDFEKYDLVAMPVIDSIGRLVGRPDQSPPALASDRRHRRYRQLTDTRRVRGADSGRGSTRHIYTSHRRHRRQCRRAGLGHRRAGPGKRTPRT